MGPSNYWRRTRTSTTTHACREKQHVRKTMFLRRESSTMSQLYERTIPHLVEYVRNVPRCLRYLSVTIIAMAM